MSAAVTNRVQLVGVGACTAVGRDAPSSAAAVRAAISGFADHPYKVDKAGVPMVVARVFSSQVDPDMVEDSIALAVLAAEEASRSLTRGQRKFSGIPLVLGLPPARPGRPANLDTEITQQLKAELGGGSLISAVRTVPHGHAAGLAALEQAWRLIRSGEIDICLVGGVDSYDHDDTLDWLDELEQLNSKVNKWGFVPGQAAGFVLLSSQPFANKHNLPNLGEVLSVSLARENNLIKTESVCVGEGLSQAVRQVLSMMGGEEKAIHQTICDLNGERYRATEFGYTLTRTGDRFLDPGQYTAPADCWGDVGAASAPLFISLAVAAAQKEYSAGPNTLIWASSESGERGAAIIRIEAAEGKA